MGDTGSGKETCSVKHIIYRNMMIHVDISILGDMIVYIEIW